MRRKRGHRVAALPYRETKSCSMENCSPKEISMLRSITPFFHQPRSSEKDKMMFELIVIGIVGKLLWNVLTGEREETHTSSYDEDWWTKLNREDPGTARKMREDSNKPPWTPRH